MSALHRTVWRRAALPQESLGVGAVLFRTLHTARERLARALSGPSFGRCLRRWEPHRRRFLVAGAGPFDCKLEVRAPRAPLNSPWRSQGASGRGGPHRAGSGRRGEAHSCVGRSEKSWWGPGQPGGHGRARPASSGVWLYGLSSTRRSPWSDGSVWPGAVGRPPLPRVCGGPSHVKNLHSSLDADFFDYTSDVRGPTAAWRCWPEGVSGRGGPRRAGRGRRGEVHSCMGRSEGRLGEGARWAEGEKRPAVAGWPRAASPWFRRAVSVGTFFLNVVPTIRQRRCAFLRSLAERRRKGWHRPA